MVSDSEAQACMFLGQIKQSLQENEDIINLFHIKRNEKGLVEFIKETDNKKYRLQNMYKLVEIISKKAAGIDINMLNILNILNNEIKFTNYLLEQYKEILDSEKNNLSITKDSIDTLLNQLNKYIN